MSQFEFYYDDWIDVDPFLNFQGLTKNGIELCKLKVNLSTEFFSNLRFDNESLKSYRINAAISCAKQLGSKPALCLSGGIDSQATWQCFNEANIDIDVYTLAFKHGLNIQDLDHAIKFSKEKNFKLNIIEIDILNFLARENAEYSIKYESLSPHFNTHYKLCNILLSKGYTGFVCGGAAPLITDYEGVTDSTKFLCTNYPQNFMTYMKYSKIEGVMCQGNFLGYHPSLAWATTLLTPVHSDPVYDYENRGTIHRAGFISQEDRDKMEYQRYCDKVKGYERVGFDIIPQQKKYTGFELVKDKLKEIYNDGWAFEKMYRMPLLQDVQEVGLLYDFDDDIVDIIKRLNIKQSAPSNFSPSGVRI